MNGTDTGDTFTQATEHAQGYQTNQGQGIGALSQQPNMPPMEYRPHNSILMHTSGFQDATASLLRPLRLAGEREVQVPPLTTGLGAHGGSHPRQTTQADLAALFGNMGFQQAQRAAQLNPQAVFPPGFPVYATHHVHSNLTSAFTSASTGMQATGLGQQGNADGNNNNASTEPTQGTNATNAAPRIIIDVTKSGITPFDGTPSRLEPFLYDIGVFLTTRGVTVEDYPQLVANVIYMLCTEELRNIFRQLGPAISTDPTQMITYLRNYFGVRQADRLAELLGQLINLKQHVGESVREYYTRATALILKLAAENNQLNFLQISNGAIASYLVRNGLRNEYHKSLLYFDGSLNWPDFEQRMIHISQADNRGNIDYDGNAHMNMKQKTFPNKAHQTEPYDDQRDYKFCSYHGKNRSHTTKECYHLNKERQSSVESVDSNSCTDSSEESEHQESQSDTSSESSNDESSSGSEESHNSD